MAKREIYTQRLRAGKRIYYFDICESSGERLYVKISERKRTGANSQEHHRLIVYPEDLEDFVDELNDLVEEFRERFNHGEELERREPFAADDAYRPDGHRGGYGEGADSDPEAEHEGPEEVLPAVPSRGVPNTGNGRARGGGSANPDAESEMIRRPAAMYDQDSHD